MSLDTIIMDRSRCIGCGLCARICHERCITLVDRAATIDHGLCSTCSQCIAVCPQQALSWRQVAPLPYDKSRLPSARQLDELFKQRRTIRFFTEEQIDRSLLEEIVAYGAYAPTNNYDLRVIVVDDAATMWALARVVLGFVRTIYTLFYRSRIVTRLIRMITPGMTDKDKVKMEEALAQGEAFDLPAATAFVVGDSRIALSLVSAQYALYNMILYAQVRGIGTRLKGTGQIFLDRSREARRLLGLQRHEHILGTLELGYPAVKFANKVEGKTLPVSWAPDGLAPVSKQLQGAREVRS